VTEFDQEAKKLDGKQVQSINASDDTQVMVKMTDGSSARFDLEGDCCSNSFFTDVKEFDELIGSVIQSVEQRSDLTPKTPERPGGRLVCRGADCTSWHFLVFTTNKGHVTIDWRNESNGYYDGCCYLKVSAP